MQLSKTIKQDELDDIISIISDKNDGDNLEFSVKNTKISMSAAMDLYDQLSKNWMSQSMTK